MMIENRPKRRTQAERRETTRKMLVEAAITCLGRVGYAAATTQMIVEEAGVTRGALNHHFADRNDLMLAVCELVLDNYASELLPIAQLDGPLETKMSAMARTWWKVVKGGPYRAYMEVLMATWSDAEMRARHLGFAHRIDRTSLAIWLATFKDVGASPDLLQALRDQLIYSLRGMLLSYQFFPDDRYMDSQLEFFSRMAVNEIRRAGQDAAAS